jgi:hypothetical protein
MPRWGPAKPKTRMKIVPCGEGEWDERDHGLDIPHPIATTNFKVTGTGHDRIEKVFHEGCVNCRKIVGYNKRQPEHRIADWLCRNVCSFVLFNTTARSTVIGFEREEDAEAFSSRFIL